MDGHPQACRRRFAGLALGCILLSACASRGPNTLGARLSRVEGALGAPHAGAATYLRYAVDAEDAGAWSREIVIAPGVYAERRIRREDGAGITFGRDARGAWLKVGDGAVLAENDEAWDQDARTSEGIFGLHFERPAANDKAEYLGKYRKAWEFAYRPSGGRTVTFTVDRRSDRPRAFDLVDDFGRLVTCNKLGWAQGDAGPFLDHFRCEANDRFGLAGKVLASRFTLEEKRPLDPATIPAWAAPGPARSRARPLAGPEAFPIVDAREIRLPVRAGDTPAQELILDSGAFYTILTEKAAREMGVVPTGDTRLHVDPPWLARSHLWVGVVERMTIGGVELLGERVLVAENPRHLAGQAAGLLGESFFRRFIIDVDSPARAVRITPREGFRPDAGRTLLRLSGSGSRAIPGEVIGVARGALTLDTGMSDDIIVHDFNMSVVHRRTRGSDALLGEGPDATRSPDYFSEIAGLRFGPFPFPKMDAIGRDQDREFLPAGVAVVGMGVMRYFRLAFDFRSNLLYAWPGDGYRTLRRAGMDLEEGSLDPIVDRVIDGGPADRAGIKRGDEIVRVGARRGLSLEAARRAIGQSEERWIDVLVRRRGMEMERPLSLRLDDPI